MYLAKDSPVLAQDEGTQGRDHCPQNSCEGPPGILHDEPREDDDSTERVVDQHHLGGAPQDPVHELEDQGLVCERDTEPSAGAHLGCLAAMANGDADVRACLLTQPGLERGKWGEMGLQPGL